MNKIYVMISVLILAVVAVLVIFSLNMKTEENVEVSEPITTETSEVNTSNIYEVMPSVISSDVVPQEGIEYYYFYQPTCSHCEQIKPDLVEFYNQSKDSLDAYVVDLTLAENEESWAKAGDDNGSQIGDEINTVGDIQILGTPTLVVVEDGVISEVAVGEIEVVDVFQAAVE